MLWWEATSVGSICLVVNSRGSERESGEKFSAHEHECTFERFWKGTFCMFEAEMDSPDRRVILHSLGFGWGGGEN